MIPANPGYRVLLIDDSNLVMEGSHIIGWEIYSGDGSHKRIEVYSQIYDETINPREYAILNPDGTVVHLDVTYGSIADFCDLYGYVYESILDKPDDQEKT